MKQKLPLGMLLIMLASGAQVSAQNPGGIIPAAWYRADAAGTVFSDAGTTPAATNTAVQQWNGQGGLFPLLQATSGSRPIYSNTTTLANFNPTLSFDGSNDWMQFTAGTGVNVIDRTNGTIYAAGFMNTLKRSGFMGFHASMDYPGLHVYSSNYNLLFFTGGPGYQGQGAAPFTAQSFFTAGTAWQNGAGTNSSYAAATVSYNGLHTEYAASQLNNVDLSTGARDLRIGADNNYGSFSGQLNEVLVFEDRLTPTQMEQVETYLAVKYGTSYANGTKDYKSSTGTTVWTAAANAGNKNNLAGIARDDNGALLQKQSWSTNAGQQVLIGVGGLANTNAANSGTLANNQYLIWGDNGLQKTPSVAVAGMTGLSHRFAAIWKVQNTGVGTVRVAWPKNLANLSLIQSTDSIIAAGDVVTTMTGEVTVNSVVYNYADVTLTNGQYFTFAAKLAAPGGVSGPAVWLKADAGTTLSGSSISGWVNYGVSGGVAGQLPRTTTLNWALPKYGANEHNFNPAIIDDVPGTNDGSLLLADVFPTTGHRPLSSFVLHSHNNVAAQNNMLSFTPLKRTSGALEAPYLAANGANNLWFYWQGPYQSAPTLPNALKRYNNIPSANAFYVPQWVSGTPHQTTMSMNGATVTTPAYNFNATAYPFGNQLFIFGDGDNNNGSGGKISEVITYARDLTVTEKLQVNSYLAIKYGLTQTNAAGTNTTNYLNSAAAVVWDTTVNIGYNKNIGGIANDQESTLNQKQSKSVNAGQQVLIATTGLANTNAANATSLTNGQYLVWGDNGLGKVPAVALTGVSGVNFRFAAVWKVQNTGSAGTVRVAWPAGLTNLTLLQGTDPTFASVAASHLMTGNTITVSGVTYNYADVTLANGQFFTFATQLNGPGGVALNLRVWLRSDAGFAPEEWADLSGNANNFTQTNASRQPFLAAKKYNFNPIVDFGTTGADARFMVVPSGKPFTANGSNATLFTATLSKDPSGYTDIWGFGGTTTTASLTNANAPTFTKLGSNVVLYPYTTAPALPVTLNRLYIDDVSFTIGTSGIKYGQNGQVATTAQTYAAGNADFANGSILGAQPEVRNGYIGEAIAYERDLTEAEKQRVRTYIAIKYGITLQHDYIASNGTTIFWNRTTNTGYNNNIAGIVRDDNGSLNQKQSSSINSAKEVLISTVGLNDENANNPNMLANQQFLTWGDNGLGKAPSVNLGTISGLPYNRFAAVWKVQNTATVGTVRVAWPKGYSNMKLIQSTDTTINMSDVITDMTNTIMVAGKEYVYTDVTLANGSYFTFAAVIQGPGGVTNNLTQWYRADVDVESDGEGTDVSSWADFNAGVISRQIAEANLPKFKKGDATYFNFNPGVNFTATDQKIGNIEVPTVSSLNYDIFTLTKEGMSGSRYFNVGMNNTTLNGNNWDHPGLYANGDIARRDNTGGGLVIANPGNINFLTTAPSIMYHKFTNLDMSKGLNGATVGALSTHSARGAITGGHIFGANNGVGSSGDDGGFTGNIGEVIIYGNGTITAAERNKVDAYLAIKYGITLNNTNNYTTAQNVVVWNATANAGFYNNVAGVGNDFLSALHQKQSRSQHTNTNGQVTMGLGEIAATNMDNPNALSDGQFLLWGDNGNTVAMTNTASTFTAFNYEGGTNNARRMKRTWKVQNTGVSSTMLLRFPVASVGTTTLPVGDPCGAYAILFADDTAFTTNLTVVPLTVNGTDYEVQRAFANGMSYFTFAKLTPLNTGQVYLPAVTESTVTYDNACNVGTWKYFHKTGDATQKLFGASDYTATELGNLEVTITPEGVEYNDGTRITKVMPRITTVTNNNVGAISNGKVRIYYSVDEMNATIVPGSQTNGWFKYEGGADSVLTDVYNDGLFNPGKAIALTPAVSGIENGVHYVEFHNINSFSSFVYISSTEITSVVLPVTMLYFAAEANGSEALLSWGTAKEQVNKGFEIERSADGEHWSRIGFVASRAVNGNSASRLDYTFTDKAPLEGKNFYRLKQIGLDGKDNYSQVSMVVFEGTKGIRVYPNPVSNRLTVDGLSAACNIRVVNSTGQVLKTYKVPAGTQKQEINMNDLASGLYFIHLVNEQGNISTFKVMKD